VQLVHVVIQVVPLVQQVQQVVQVPLDSREPRALLELRAGLELQGLREPLVPRALEPLAPLVLLVAQALPARHK
jgi:hypothetical protein